MLTYVWLHKKNIFVVFAIQSKTTTTKNQGEELNDAWQLWQVFFLTICGLWCTCWCDEEMLFEPVKQKACYLFFFF